MAIDSNRPYQRINVQQNNNDTIWNGAVWGAGAGVGAAGLTYGVTEFGAKGLANLNYKVAGNKTVRDLQRHQRLQAGGKPHMTEETLKGIHNYRMEKAHQFTESMAKVNKFGNRLFGTKGRAIATTATGLLGGMLAGSAVDYMN